MEPIIPDQQALRLVVRQDLSDAEKYRLAQADTLMRLIKADSIEEAERMLSDSSIQQLVQEHNQKMRGGPSPRRTTTPPSIPGAGKSSPTLTKSTQIRVVCEWLDSHKNELPACVEVTTRKGHCTSSGGGLLSAIHGPPDQR